MAVGSNGAVLRQFGRIFQYGSHAGLTDRQLLERFIVRRDDEGQAELAFAALVSRHGPMVRGVCLRLLRDHHAADDAFQAAFLVLVRKARSIRVPPTGSLGPWLHGVTHRIAVRAARARIRSRTFSDATPTPEPVDDADPDLARLERAERLAALHDELGRLPDKYRAPVVLCHLEGLTHEEAARRLGWPLGTVKGRLSRARDRLRDRLARRGVAPSLAVVSALLTREARACASPLPATLAESIARTAHSLMLAPRALLATSGAGTVPAPAAALAQGALTSMTLAHLSRTAASLIVSLGLAAGAAGGYALVDHGPGRASLPDDNAAVGEAAVPGVDSPAATTAPPAVDPAAAEQPPDPASRRQAIRRHLITLQRERRTVREQAESLLGLYEKIESQRHSLVETQTSLNRELRHLTERLDRLESATDQALNLLLQPDLTDPPGDATTDGPGRNPASAADPTSTPDAPAAPEPKDRPPSAGSPIVPSDPERTADEPADPVAAIRDHYGKARDTVEAEIARRARLHIELMAKLTRLDESMNALRAFGTDQLQRLSAGLEAAEGAEAEVSRGIPAEVIDHLRAAEAAMSAEVARLSKQKHDLTEKLASLRSELDRLRSLHESLCASPQESYNRLRNAYLRDLKAPARSSVARPARADQADKAGLDAFDALIRGENPTPSGPDDHAPKR